MRKFDDVKGTPPLPLSAHTLLAAARQWETPLYVYDLDTVARQFHRLQAALPTGTLIYYALKANPNLALCRFLARLGAGAEIASAGELLLAQQAGFAADRIVFSGPGKSRADLLAALTAGIAVIHVESLEEIERLAQFSRPGRVALRINGEQTSPGGTLCMDGAQTAFGLLESELDAASAALARIPQLRLVGLHSYSATQMLDYGDVLTHITRTLAIAQRLGSAHDLEWEYLNIGAGFGVPYFAGQLEFDMAALAPALRELVQQVCQHPALRRCRLAVESGRYLVAQAGVYLMQVEYVKQRGETFLAITNGGTHHWRDACALRSGAAETDGLGQFPLYNLTQTDQAVTGRVDVLGPLCTPHDALARGVAMPRPYSGDILALPNAGAYGLTAAPFAFLGHPAPAEVVATADSLQLARRRGNPEAILHGQAPHELESRIPR